MSGRGIFIRKCPINSKHPIFIPTEQQIAATNAFVKSKYKGMLLYHKLGSGKTCTAIKIADEMLRLGKVSHIYILSPGSVRETWVNEYCKVCGISPRTLEKYYTFITYNYSVGDKMLTMNLDDSLIIIDEVHNLINGARNQSNHPTKIYNAIANSNCRVLALSGTPIYNYVEEFSILAKLLKPSEFGDTKIGEGTVDSSFVRQFVISGNGAYMARNPGRVNKMLEGIISYYPGATKEHIPSVIEMPPIKIQMTPYQEQEYWQNNEQEITLSRPPSKSLSKKNKPLFDLLSRLYIMAKKNILTRKTSNFHYPEEAEDQPDLTTNEGGWLDKDKFQNGELKDIYSPKFSAFLVNLVLHLNQKHVVFTFFKNQAGAYLLKSILGMCGIRAEIFSGDLDDKQRRSLLTRFNSVKNMYGDVIRVLIVTEAGAEGISLLDTRHMHILESSPRVTKTTQAIGRAARYKSHSRLPPNERNVKIWRYWSMPSLERVNITTKIYAPDGREEQISKTITDKTGIDEALFKKGERTLTGINSFLKLLKKSSVTPYKEDTAPEIGGAKNERKG